MPPGRWPVPRRSAGADEDVAMPLVSPGTRLVASDMKATKRPSAEIDGGRIADPSPWTPRGPRSPARSCPVWRSRTKTSPARWCRPGRGWWRPTRRPRSARPPRSHGVAAAAVALRAARSDAHPLGRARLAVVHEDVAAPLVSPGTRLVASERRPRSARRPRSPAPTAAPSPCRRPADADPLGRARLAVAHEDVARAVGVARDEVGGVRVEGDEAPVAPRSPADCRCRRCPGRRARHAHPLGRAASCGRGRRRRACRWCRPATRLVAPR